MNVKTILALLFILPFTASAQIFNFSLKTNNQQLIEKALEGAFVKISQAYELCDTVNDEHFGRNEKDYFSIIPFIGVETERGLIFPSRVMTPWTIDKDYAKYEGQYKPIVTRTILSILGDTESNAITLDSTISGTRVSENLCLIKDSTQSVPGFRVDSLPGVKDGWLIWIVTENGLPESDSVKYLSVKKDLEILKNGSSLPIEKPEVEGVLQGGIFVIPEHTGVGQLSFTLSGILVSDGEGWNLEFPFIDSHKQSKTLTPIQGIYRKGDVNPLKSKKK